MRSLTNRFDKHQWLTQQQAQVRRLGVAGLQVAFPGSLLCNHILLPVASSQGYCTNQLAVPDVSAVVYEYCSRVERYTFLEGALVVDIDGDSDVDLIASVIVEHAKKLRAKQVVLLGKSAYRLYADAIRSQLSVQLCVYEPDWMSAVALHGVYRQAALVLFVNTMRVLDAACTGCRCGLIADRKMQNHQTFGMLQSYLRSAGCDVYAVSGVATFGKNSGTLRSHTVVENNHAAVQKALRRGANTEVAEPDWLAELCLHDAVPVITPCQSVASQWLTNLRDSKTAAQRKFAKFYDDPKAFFEDSKFRTLRVIGKFYPEHVDDAEPTDGVEKANGR